jgi:hypothetical protein
MITQLIMSFNGERKSKKKQTTGEVVFERPGRAVIWVFLFCHKIEAQLSKVQ